MSEPATSGAGDHGHGKPSSWAIVALFIVCVIVGGFALILHIMWLLYVCAGVFVVAIGLGAAVRIMDDTVTYPVPQPQAKAVTSGSPGQAERPAVHQGEASGR